MSRPGQGAAIVHGANVGNAGYVSGCRCQECREGHRLYQREYRARQATGTFVFRSVNKYGRPTSADEIALRVGDDFPALGTLLRAMAVMSA